LPQASLLAESFDSDTVRSHSSSREAGTTIDTSSGVDIAANISFTSSASPSATPTTAFPINDRIRNKRNLSLVRLIATTLKQARKSGLLKSVQPNPKVKPTSEPPPTNPYQRVSKMPGGWTDQSERDLLFTIIKLCAPTGMNWEEVSAMMGELGYSYTKEAVR
jgi:hypothetical protein